MKVILLYLILLMTALNGVAQHAQDSVLAAVASNNKEIIANKEYWETRRLEYRTGLSLYDPEVEYDHLFGSPAGAGVQKDFTITQRMDFPSVYKRKRKLSRQLVDKSVLEHQVFRQDMLLKAHLLVLDMIFLNRKVAAYKHRVKQTADLVSNYQRKLDRGEATILEFNKARLQLMNVRHDLALAENEAQTAHTRLSDLNGGRALDVADTTYPALPIIPDFETLDSTIENNDPIIKVYDQEIAIIKQNISVQKALNLPRLEAGYHSQSILGQSYKGFHTGISIPLWENRNKLNAVRSNFRYVVANTDRHRTEHRSENKQLYEQLAVRHNAMKEYAILFKSLNNQYLLDKALRLGEITIVEYFEDESFYFASYDKYLQLELEYHKAVASLYKFTL